MKKKIVSVLLCTAMVAGMLAGCGGGKAKEDTSASKDGSGKRYVTEVQADDVEFLAKPGAGGGSSSYGGASDSYGSPAPAPKKSAPQEDELFNDEELNGVILEDETLPF